MRLILSNVPSVAQKLNNASYSSRLNNDRWTPQETELFFKVSTFSGFCHAPHMSTFSA